MYKTYYHIFSDRRDFYTESFSVAVGTYNLLKNRYANVRLYRCIEDTITMQDVAEECLEAIGDYPI